MGALQQESLLPHSVAKRPPTRPSKAPGLASYLGILNGDSRDEMENLNNTTTSNKGDRQTIFPFPS